MRMPNKYGGVGSIRSCRDWYVAATYKNPPCSLLPRKLWLKKECPRLPTMLPVNKDAHYFTGLTAVASI